MNEPLFYNSFTYSEEMAKEIAFHFLFKTKLMKFFLTVIIIFLPINILISVLTGQITFYQISTFALTGMTFILWPIAYFSMVKANTPKGNDDGFSVGRRYFRAYFRHLFIRVRIVIAFVTQTTH